MIISSLERYFDKTASVMKIDKIFITGHEQTTSVAVTMDELDTPSRSFIIERSRRGATESHEVDISQGEVVELIFEDETRWLCNANTLLEVFPETAQKSRASGGAVQLPTEVRGESSERGIIDSIALKVVNIFAKKAIQKGVLNLAKELEVKQLENQSGLYTLDKQFRLQPFQALVSEHPYLLFLHGTASSTAGSFAELVTSDLWEQMQRTYGSNILAFQHETLSKSPLQNTLELIKQLPAHCTLHLVSHSRGGLVGELLCRFCNTDEGNRGFDEQEKAYLAKTNRTDDLALIEQLNEVLAGKHIHIERFVRVACPASGTILASGRMERFFNITLNLIGYSTGLAANPVYLAFKNLVGAVLESKDDVTVLPGLEAMNPESAFIKVLNNPGTTVEVDIPLAVISGNCTMKPDFRALLIIASKLFYLTDNDLVVNTLSMYQGTKRKRPAQFYFDSSTEIDHFHYFKNPRTVSSLALALQATDDALLPGFQTVPRAGGLPADRNAALGLEGGKLFLDTVTGTKPIVLLLPGIMGSTLDTDKTPLWINYWRFVKGDLVDLAVDKQGVSATAIVKTSYKRLADYLSGTYDVVTFPFDWRLSLPESAALLNDKIVALLKYNRPLKVIAHSMGGVLMRDFILGYAATWQQLNHSAGFRLLMLGVPFRGSHRIPAVLFGLDGIIKKLSQVDMRHTKEELVAVFAQFPGILGLLPLSTGPGEDFADSDTWTTMRKALGNPSWPLPSAELLQNFADYRTGILNGCDTIDFTNVVYIAGQDEATPYGYHLNTLANGQQALEFLYTAEGDQSVTWATGIPSQLLRANAVYYTSITHGALANEPRIFGGLAEILAKGTTAALSRIRPKVRAVSPTVELSRTEDFDLSPAGVEKTLLGLTITDPAEAVAALPRIRVRVSNGDLRYASFPLLAGHFFSDSILYAESVIDQYLDGALTELNKLGIYPGPIGTSDVFVPPGADYAGAIVLGLGHFGQLTAFQLTITVEQGVSKYLHSLASRPARPEQAEAIGLSSLVIGSGYGGLTVESTVRAILQGVQNANAKLRKLLEDRAPAVSYLEFIEVYEDTALSTFYAAKTLELEASKSLPIEVEGTTIKTVFGVKKRLLAGQTSGWWNRLNVQLSAPAYPDDLVRTIRFSMSTGGAREEQRELNSSTKVLTQLLNDLSVNNRWSASLAKTVFELLIPNDLKETLQRQSNINWILDKDTAAYPWELLQDSVNDAKPLCINAGMIRQLATQDYRLNIRPVVKETALVIGDPQLDGFLSQLSGARQEAGAVSELLNRQGLATTTNLGGNALSIIRELFQEDYKIIHLAGHGVFLEDQPQNSGMVIGNNLYLSTREIIQMSTVPELVFVNCCFLGQTDGIAERFYRNRYRLAANIGTQLIENGVKAVVVAGWAVDDAAALTFAQTFYSQLASGCAFGEAVLAARNRVYEQSGDQNNTWGAYQCYGDPFYKLRSGSASGATPELTFVVAEEAEVALVNLYNEVESGRYSAEKVLARMDAIAQGVDNGGLRTPEITEREAVIYVELYEYEAALAKFNALLKAEKASFSVATLEKYCNLRAKYCVQQLTAGRIKRPAALKELKDVIRDHKALLTINTTAERLSLLGSAYKRKALVVSGEKINPETLDALRAAAYYYRASCLVAGNAYRIYSLTNWYMLEAIVDLCAAQPWASKRSYNGESYELPALEEVQQQLREAAAPLAFESSRMDYWTLMESAGGKLCQLFINPAEAATDCTLTDLLELYRRMWLKAGSKGKKMTEVEAISFLSQVVQLAPNPTKETAQLQQLMDRLNGEVQRMVVN